MCDHLEPLSKRKWEEIWLTAVCHQAFDVGATWVKSSILSQLHWHGRMAISKGIWEILDSLNLLDLTHLAPISKALWQTAVNHISSLLNGHRSASIHSEKKIETIERKLTDGTALSASKIASLKAGKCQLGGGQLAAIQAQLPKVGWKRLSISKVSMCGGP